MTVLIDSVCRPAAPRHTLCTGQRRPARGFGEESRRYDLHPHPIDHMRPDRRLGRNLGTLADDFVARMTCESPRVQHCGTFRAIDLRSRCPTRSRRANRERRGRTACIRRRVRMPRHCARDCSRAPPPVRQVHAAALMQARTRAGSANPLEGARGGYDVEARCVWQVDSVLVFKPQISHRAMFTARDLQERIITIHPNHSPRPTRARDASRDCARATADVEHGHARPEHSRQHAMIACQRSAIQYDGIGTMRLGAHDVWQPATSTKR